MVFVGKAIPLLFAAPSALRTNIHFSGAGSITSLRSTVEKTAKNNDAPFRLSDMVETTKNTYSDLAKGCFVTEATPTISFQYIRPLSERASSDNIAFFEEELSGCSDTSQTIEKIQATHDNEKPLLLYLPGLDGVGISAVRQYDDLSNAFEFWRMRVDPINDRSTFSELTTAVSSFIQDVAMKQNRKVILVGESFGGLLAPAVAMKMEAIAGKENSPVMGLVMVNPATSFYKTNWSTWAPILASLRHIEQEEEEGSSSSLPTPYSVLGGIALSVTIPDSSQFQSIFDIFSKTATDELQTIVESMRDGFGILADNLPAKVIEHRVGQWCNVGSQVVNPRLHKLNVPTLFIGGDEDNMLPTKEEGDRLVNLMPDCTSMAVKDAGHFILDDRFNLTSAIIDAPFDPFNKKTNKKKYDPITDWKVPSEDDIREAVESKVKPLRDLVSPQFFSTGSDGKRKLGLGKVPTPDDGPLLFVANHQLIGLDLSMIIAQLLEERNIAARGLAHPIIFQGGNAFGGGAGPTPGPPQRITKRNKEGPVDPPPDDFQTWGAVMVSPRNFYRLMSTGQTGLLFPGGAREVFHGKGEDYELFWPEKADFVRVAARFNATIVPISAVGSADSANILLDPDELLNLPFGLGDRLRNSSENTISARFDQSNSDERFVPPLVVPSVPARHYFVFGKPFETSTIDHGDKASCTNLYGEIKSELRRGLDDVLVAREKDPFKEFAQRLAVERISGKPAPTFSVEELNKNI
eukprot:CAMPEP_0201998868 /NCGR_PEP_ID=MMETSP0905-20130828/5561_1 /ASSEMBLY_ACC=CAM_ASM_000554 /TAXON_ID=420261 /ORGANISM="Thalassiosira antarctica, Strain CCMP982" /LENGTH=747 /DNA_ID=CAMNT_0048554955 /DNA_START=1 /DNA_END=2244 /DNA_ORIENTATION=+